MTTTTATTTDLEIAAPEGGELVFDNTTRQLVADQIAPGASPAEIELFLHVAAHVQLDPLRNQIWLVPRYDSQLRRKVFKPQTGIDGMRLIAQRTGLYGGSLAPEWCGEDGRWVDVWINTDTPPAAARFRVVRKDWTEPAVGVATWDQFAVEVPKYEQRNGKNTKVGTKLAPMWEKFGAHMLAKCAEAQALRRAFPAEMSGVYSEEEMTQADRDTIDVARVPDSPVEPDIDRAKVREIFDALMPTIHQVGDVDAFKAQFRAAADDAGVGPVDSITANALTLPQAELLRDLHAEIVGTADVIEGEVVDEQTIGTSSLARDYARSIDIDCARLDNFDVIQAIADYHGCTPEEALDHARQWAGGTPQ